MVDKPEMMKKVHLFQVLHLILIILYSSFVDCIDIQWIPGENEDSNNEVSAATAPRSQRYWDEHNIIRPDYAKTDEEVYMEQQQRRRGQGQGRGRGRKKMESQSLNEKSIKQNNISNLVWLSIILFFLLSMMVGYDTERRILANANNHRMNFQQMKSRYIWDKTREPNARLYDQICAILYEFQPIRMTTILAYPWKSKFDDISQGLILILKLMRPMMVFVSKSTMDVFSYIYKYWGWNDYLYFCIFPLIYIWSVSYLHR